MQKKKRVLFKNVWNWNVGYLGLEPRAIQLKAEYSTIELVAQKPYVYNTET